MGLRQVREYCPARLNMNLHDPNHFSSPLLATLVTPFEPG
jgi:hypothetical protein